MAHVQKRTRNGKVTWRARYRTAGGRERSKTFTRRTDADRWLVNAQAEMNRGHYIDPGAGRISLRDYAEQWRVAQVHRPSTADVTRSRLHRHVLPAFGHRPIASILPSEVQAWVKRLSLAMSPATVEACYRLLATILRSAVADRLIPSSPCIRIRLPEKGHQLIEPLTIEQVDAVRSLMPARARAIVTIAAGSGIRQGEAFGLTVDRVNFLRRTLTVDRQLVKHRGCDIQFGPPKTKASVRTIPVPDLVLEALSTHLSYYPAQHEWNLVFTNAHGRPWSRSRFAEIWREAADNAGLPEGARFHDLRHHTASLLIAAGCSVKVVQHQLGHASAVETLDTYGHLWKSDDDRVRQAVNSAIQSCSELGIRSDPTSATSLS